MDWIDIIAIGLIFATVVLMIFQWNEMGKTTAATALTTIISILQAEDVRKARECLTNISEMDFSKWTDDEKTKAEVACSTFDTVGILLKEKVVKHELVTAPWRHSIIKCRKNAKPMIDSYRADRGETFWEHFDWLVGKAKETS